MFTNIYYNFAYHKNTMKLTCPLFFSKSSFNWKRCPAQVAVLGPESRGEYKAVYLIEPSAENSSLTDSFIIDFLI